MPRKSTANERRGEIIPVVAALFDSRGYHLVSVADAARAAGLSKAALYHYFPSKEKILFAIHDEFMRSVIERVEGRIAERQRPLDALRGVTHDILGLFETHPGYVRVFLEHYRELGAADQRAIAKKRERYRDLVVGIVERGAAAGDFRADVDAETAVRGLFGMCAWTVQWWERGRDPAPAEIAESINDLLLSGLAARRGRGRRVRQATTGATSAPAARRSSISPSV